MQYRRVKGKCKEIEHTKSGKNIHRTIAECSTRRHHGDMQNSNDGVKILQDFKFQGQ